MIKSKTIGSRIFTVVNTLILAILALSCLYPLWYNSVSQYQPKKLWMPEW